jgi:hypothetical protein
MENRLHGSDPIVGCARCRATLCQCTLLGVRESYLKNPGRRCKAPCGGRRGKVDGFGKAHLDQRGLDDRHPLFPASENRRGGGCPFAPATSEAPGAVTTGGADAPLFPSLFDLPSGGKASVSRKFKRLMQRAGARWAVPPAICRFISSGVNSMLANSGVPQELRQKPTGHQSATMNALYSHHGPGGVPGGGIEAAGSHQHLSKLNFQST